jgi:hypothetical protein
MRRTPDPTTFRPHRSHPRGRRSKVVHWLGRYGRLIIVIIITVTAALLGYHLRPRNYAIPASIPGQPYMDVMASRPGVTVTVSLAILSYNNLITDLTASTSSGSGKYTLYVEVSGVHAPQLSPNDYRVASDGGSEYSMGNSYTLKSHYYYSDIPFVVTYRGCGCLRESGPYLAVAPLSLDPIMVGPHKKISTGGTTLTPVGSPFELVIFPGREPGKYYPTSLALISDDQVNLDGADVPPNLSMLNGYPQNPTNPQANTWQWNKVSTASVTLMNLARQNTLNDYLFYAGIFLGIAGAGVLALVPEVSRVLTAWRSDKGGSRRRTGPPRRHRWGRWAAQARTRARRGFPAHSSVSRVAMLKRRSASARRHASGRRGPDA